MYLAAFLDGAILAAELAVGDGRGRVYIVEPTGSIDDDPNVTDKKFPGNPTKSYRTREPLLIVRRFLIGKAIPRRCLKKYVRTWKRLNNLVLRQLTCRLFYSQLRRSKGAQTWRILIHS